MKKLCCLVSLLVILFCSCSYEVKKEPEMPLPGVDANMDEKTALLCRESAGRHVDQQHLVEQVLMIFNEAQSDFPGVMGACFCDLSSGYECGVKNRTVFPAASVIKLPILYTVFNEIQNGSLEPGDTIVLREEDKVGGSGVLKGMAAGREFTIDELSSMMITRSDNTATDLLLEKVGMDNINARMKELNLTRTITERKIFDFDAMDRGCDNVTSPEDMKILLEALFKNKVAYSKKMIEILKQQKRRDILPALLPPGQDVAHKTGELLGVLHDVGIIFYRERPYILCLMGKDVYDKERARQSFARISGRIFTIIEKAYPGDVKNKDEKEIIK